MSETPPPEPPTAETPEDMIGAQLVDGETLVWAGRPDRAALAGSNPFRSVFGRVVLIIGAVMVYMALEAMSVNPRSPGVFALLFGIVFMIFGGGLALKTFENWWCAPATYYGVTDKRAIIMRTRPWSKVQNFGNHQIAFVVSEPFGNDGLGNVLFANEPFGRLRALRAAVGFWGVARPDEAKAALQRLKDTFDLTLT